MTLQTNLVTGDGRIRILVVSGNQLHADLLVEALAHGDGSEVVGSTINPSAAVELAGRVLPDLVLLSTDAALGPAVARAILAAAPSVVIVAVGLSETVEDMLPWADAGVARYLTRTMSIRELLRVVAEFGRTGTQDSPHLHAPLLRSVLDSNPRSLPGARTNRLTSREREVAELMAGGLTNKEIATRLWVSLPTVKSHVHSILAKLEARTRAEVAAVLGPHGIVGRGIGVGQTTVINGSGHHRSRPLDAIAVQPIG